MISGFANRVTSIVLGAAIKSAALASVRGPPHHDFIPSN